jgi:hypothetical protein
MEELNFLDKLNKLYATFCIQDNLEELIKEINNKYSVLYKKIFILKSQESSELICTYNIDTGNINNILPNTILMHRKKESNTLYTINALNNLIMSLNEGKLDKYYPIPWNSYKNSILLTQGSEVRRLNTSIHNIVTLN